MDIKWAMYQETFSAPYGVVGPLLQFEVAGRGEYTLVTSLVISSKKWRCIDFKIMIDADTKFNCGLM